MTNLFLQIIVAACFVGLVIMLFFENQEYLSYAFIFMLLAALISAIFLPEARVLLTYVDAVEWEVIFFFLPMLIIINILDPVFEEIALQIIRRQAGKKIRRLFVIICVIVTIAGSIITATSTVLIFVPIIVRICRKLRVNPAPFMMGISISINLAATLTPFGSAQNVVIFTHFQRDALWFFTYLGPYFLFTITITILLMQWMLIRPTMISEWCVACIDEKPLQNAVDEEETHVSVLSKSQFVINLIGLGVFFVLLLIIPQIYLVALIGLVIFISINPVLHSNGKKRIDLAHFATKVDYKLIYFFICLFILTHLMKINGSLDWVEGLIETLAFQNIFLLSIIILLLTSIISGLLDNAPVTILFLPIIDKLIEVFNGENVATVLLVAFILGINLGSNFLPQGSAADMMNLEFARKFNVPDMSFKRLTKYGALFAGIHIIIGILYLGIISLILF